MTLRTDYDAWHQRIYDAAPDHEDADSPWYLLVSEYLGSVSGLNILEIGCGRGGFTRQLARNGACVTACDFSSAALHATRNKLTAGGVEGARLVQGDAQSLPFAASAFDTIICCETIEHLPQVQAALHEMFRVARFGAKLFLTTPNYFNFMGLYELYALVRHPHRKDGQPFDRRQWFPQVNGWINRAGWRIRRTDGTVHQFPFLPGRNPLRWHSLESSRAMRKVLSPFAYTYFVLAVKPS